MQMEGLVTIVTGASRGLGYAIAREYARAGAKVVVTARASSPTGLTGTIEKTVQDIQESGGEAVRIPCDVADEPQVQAMVRQVMDR
jgi:NAD(P)-dependent dehydrogenase (short-subunit alcohol dehydrogenase family)